MQPQSIFIAHPTTPEQVNVLKAVMKALKVKFELATEKDAPYNADFEAKILRSKQDYKKGKGTTVTLDELTKLWK